MKNPWLYDEESVPDHAGVRRSGRWMRIVGTCLWLLSIGILAVFMFTDIGRQEAAAVMMEVVQIAGIATALLVAGWLVYELLKRLNLFGGTVLNIVRLGLLLLIPVLTALAAQQLGLLDGILAEELSATLPTEQLRREVSSQLTGPLKDVLPFSS